jgi:hypothetical protein
MGEGRCGPFDQGSDLKDRPSGAIHGRTKAASGKSVKGSIAVSPRLVDHGLNRWIGMKVLHDAPPLLRVRGQQITGRPALV